jgi:hypothetical protein
MVRKTKRDHRILQSVLRNPNLKIAATESVREFAQESKKKCVLGMETAQSYSMLTKTARRHRKLHEHHITSHHTQTRPPKEETRNSKRQGTRRRHLRTRMARKPLEHHPTSVPPHHRPSCSNPKAGKYKKIKNISHSHLHPKTQNTNLQKPTKRIMRTHRHHPLGSEDPRRNYCTDLRSSFIGTSC